MSDPEIDHFGPRCQYKYKMTDQLKEVRPYVNLAESIEDSNPIFGYYLRKYSIQKAHQAYTSLKSTNPPAADAVFAQLQEWMPKAEQLARGLQGQINIATNLADMLDYTDKVFLAADNEYRAKNISTELTQNFMTAWRFYQVINHFNPLNEDQAKRMKYAKVKTVEVHKLLKQMQAKQEQPYKPQPPQVTPGGPTVYRPEPPQFTPGGGMSNVQPVPPNMQQSKQQPLQSPQPYVPEAPQFTPGPSYVNSGYPTMSGIQIPTMPNMGFTPIGPPAFSNQQPVFNGMGQSKPPQQSNFPAQPSNIPPQNQQTSNIPMQSPFQPPSIAPQYPPQSPVQPGTSNVAQQQPFQPSQAPVFPTSQAPMFQPSQSPAFQPPALDFGFGNFGNFGNFGAPTGFTQPPAVPSNFNQPPPASNMNQQAPIQPVQPPAPSNMNTNSLSPPAPSQQPASSETKKKRMDPERVAAQNQAVTQLQNAISQLSFNRVGYAKQAIRNAMKLLEKYD